MISYYCLSLEETAFESHHACLTLLRNRVRSASMMFECTSQSVWLVQVKHNSLLFKDHTSVFACWRPSTANIQYLKFPSRHVLTCKCSALTNIFIFKTLKRIGTTFAPCFPTLTDSGSVNHSPKACARGTTIEINGIVFSYLHVVWR